MEKFVLQLNRITLMSLWKLRRNAAVNRSVTGGGTIINFSKVKAAIHKVAANPLNYERMVDLY
ncbi:MAG: hypothetical protein ACKOWO_03205 [Sediminibacterium sp.]